MVSTSDIQFGVYLVLGLAILIAMAVFGLQVLTCSPDRRESMGRVWR